MNAKKAKKILNAEEIYKAVVEDSDGIVSPSVSVSDIFAASAAKAANKAVFSKVNDPSRSGLKQADIMGDLDMNNGILTPDNFYNARVHAAPMKRDLSSAADVMKKMAH